MDKGKLNRRDFLRLSAMATTGTLLSACAPQVIEVTKEVIVEKPVVETVVVQEEVEKIVEVTAPPEPVRLRMWHYWTPPREEHLLAAADKFMERYPYIEVDCQLVSQDGKHERNLAAVASGDPPNMFMIWGDRIGMYVDNAALIPLDKYFRRDGLSTDLWIPSTITGGYYKNQLWGLPIIAGGDRGVWFHKDQWEEGGLDPENTPKTWQELEDAAAKLNVMEDGEFARMGFYPVNLGGSFLGGAGWIRYMYAEYNGWPAYPCDGRTVSYGENWQEAIQYVVDFTNEHCGGYETGQAFQAFALAGVSDGDAVWLSKMQTITLGGPWMFSKVAAIEMPEEEYDIFPLPYGPSFDPEVPRCGQTYTWDWALFAGQENPDDGWLLLKWLSAEQGNIDFTTGMLRPAALYEAAQDPFWAENMPRWESWLKVLDSVPKTEPPTSGITPGISETEIDKLEVEAMERVLRGDWTTAETAAFLEENMQKLYDEWWAEQA